MRKRTLFSCNEYKKLMKITDVNEIFWKLHHLDENPHLLTTHSLKECANAKKFRVATEQTCKNLSEKYLVPLGIPPPTKKHKMKVLKDTDHEGSQDSDKLLVVRKKYRKWQYSLSSQENL